MAAAIPKWRRFEQLAAHIQRTLTPGARLEQNARIRGRVTRVLREIDIAVWLPVGPSECFIAIDCKDHQAKVDVKLVEQFMGLVEDIGANRGVLVSALGFTTAAKRRGRAAGLRLLTLVDAESDTWPCVVTIPALADERRLDAIRYQFRSTELGGLAAEDLLHHEVFLADGSSLGEVDKIALQRWNEGGFPAEAGEHHGLSIVDEPVFIEAQGNLHRVEINVSIRVGRVLYLGEVPVDKLQGFRDEITGVLETRDLTTGWVGVANLDREWQVVPSEDGLAVKPVLRFLITQDLAVDE